MSDFSYVYDLPRLLQLYRVERELAGDAAARLHHLAPLPREARTVGVVSGSFNPFTHGHEALVTAARRAGCDAILLLLPLHAVDKEAVTRAAAFDRALALLRWAARRPAAGVALTNRGLYAEHAALLAERYPASHLVFAVGHDKIVQIFDPRYYVDRDATLRALFARATFQVAPRLGQDGDALHALLAREENRPFAPRVTPLALHEDVDSLSSTAVRERVRAGEPWEALVPRETALLVRATHPYAPPWRLDDGEVIDAYGLRLALVAAIAAGHLAIPDDFAALYRTACAATAAGRQVRALLNSL